MQPVQLFMSMDMPRRCLRCTTSWGRATFHVGLLVALTFVRKSRVGFELVERRIANDAALVDRLIGFE